MCQVLHYEYLMLINMKLTLCFFLCEIIFFTIIYTKRKHHIWYLRLNGTMKENHNLIVWQQSFLSYDWFGHEDNRHSVLFIYLFFCILIYLFYSFPLKKSLKAGDLVFYNLKGVSASTTAGRAVGEKVRGFRGGSQTPAPPMRCFSKGFLRPPESQDLWEAPKLSGLEPGFMRLKVYMI